MISVSFLSQLFWWSPGLLTSKGFVIFFQEHKYS